MNWLKKLFLTSNGKGPSWRMIALGVFAVAIVVLPLAGKPDTAAIVQAEQEKTILNIEKILEAVGMLIIFIDKIRSTL